MTCHLCICFSIVFLRSTHINSDFFLSPSLHSTQQQAFLLENVPCNNASCRDVGRMFHVHWEQSDLSAIPRAVVATFFDIYEDVSVGLFPLLLAF